ncbi:MAG: hypothetical protein KDE58_13075 [Caldilineaceae bacterium]|nr:hypothetical protein [Caldilineaceae bacterium]
MVTLDQAIDTVLELPPEQQEMLLDIIYRRAGRIRRWFAEMDSSVIPYLPFEAGDDRPRMSLSHGYLELRGGDIIIRMINSATIALFIVASINIAYAMPILISLCCTIPLAVMIWYAQRTYIRSRLKDIESYISQSVRFPHDEMIEIES